MFTFMDGDDQEIGLAKRKAAADAAAAKARELGLPDDQTQMTVAQIAELQTALYGEGNPDHKWRSKSLDSAELVWGQMDYMELLADVVYSFEVSPTLGDDIRALRASICRTALDNEAEFETRLRATLAADPNGIPSVPLRLDDMIAVLLICGSVLQSLMAKDDQQSGIAGYFLGTAIKSLTEQLIPQAQVLTERLLAEGKITAEDMESSRKAWDQFFGLPDEDDDHGFMIFEI